MLDMRKLLNTFERSYENDASEGQTLSDYMAERYDEVRAHQRHVRHLQKEEESIRARCEKELSDIQCNLCQIQESCTHPCTTYHPDASGNNDSMTECDICGVEL